MEADKVFALHVREEVTKIMQSLTSMQHRVDALQDNTRGLQRQLQDVHTSIHALHTDIQECREMLHETRKNARIALDRMPLRQTASPAKPSVTTTKNHYHNPPPRYLRKMAVKPNGSVLQLGDHLG